MHEVCRAILLTGMQYFRSVLWDVLLNIGFAVLTDSVSLHHAAMGSALLWPNLFTYSSCFLRYLRVFWGHKSHYYQGYPLIILCQLYTGFIASLRSPWKSLNFEKKDSRPLKVLEKSLNLNVLYFEIFAYWNFEESILVKFGISPLLGYSSLMRRRWLNM